MTDRTLRRIRLAALAATLGGALAVVALPAEAAQQETVVVSVDKPVRIEYPPIPSGAPMTAARKVDPDECRVPATYCDTIPFKVEIPDVPPGDDYRLSITVDWDHQGQVNNLDVFFWDNGQIKEEFGEPQPGDENYQAQDQSPYTLVDEGDYMFPERISVTEPGLIDYNLTVLNWNAPGTGAANLGYTIEAHIEVASFDPPFESLEPEARPTTPSGGAVFDGSGGGGGKAGAPAPSSGGGAAPLPSSAPGGQSLDLLDAQADVIFGGVEGVDLDSRLRAPLPNVTPARQEKPEPPSAAVLLLWLLVVPGAAAAGISSFVLKQRSAFNLA